MYDDLCFRLLNPLIFGDYPDIVKKNAGRRIPVFTKDESALIKGSIDFLAVNHYDTLYVRDKSSNLETDNRDLSADMAVEVMCMFIKFKDLYKFSFIVVFQVHKLITFEGTDMAFLIFHCSF